MKLRHIYLFLLFLFGGIRVPFAQTITRLSNYPESWSTFGNMEPPMQDSIDDVLVLSSKPLFDHNELFGLRLQLLLSDVPHPRIEFEAEVCADSGFFYIESEIKNIAGETEWMITGNPVNELFHHLNTGSRFKKFSFELNKEYDYARTVGGKSVTLSIGIKGPGRFRLKHFALLSDKGVVTPEDRTRLFKADTAFEQAPYYNGSGTNALPASVTTEDLFILGKTWGFLKYYHPAIRSGSYNWDFELFRFLPRFLKSCTTRDQRNALLLEWVRSLGSFETRNAPQAAVAGSIKMYPDYGWIRKNELGPALYRTLMEVRNAKRTSTGYYSGHTPDDSTVSIPFNELAYPHLKYPDAGFRLLAVFRYWACLDHLYAYRYLLNNKDQQFRHSISRFRACKNEQDYDHAVKEAVAFLNSGHTILYDVYTAPAKMLGFYAENVAGKIVVTKVNEREKTIHRGDIIERINGIPVFTRINQYKGLLPAPRPAIFYREAVRALLFTDDSSTTFSIVRNGRPLTLSTQQYLTNGSEASQLLTPVDTSFMELNKHTAYLNLPVIPDSISFCSLFKKVRNYKNLVIDLRSYPVLSWDLIKKHFFNQPSAVFKATSVDPLTPGLFRFTESGLEISRQPDSDIYKGRIAVLTNAYTQSYAETLVMAFKKRPQTITVGQATAGANGNTFAVAFPGGYFTRMEGLGVYTLQKKETQRKGLVPDYRAAPAIRDIAEGRDVFIEKAVQLLNAP
ncbi:S41 family peptidase [Niabella drilacis]|uniref:C-terminal processing protease CtpA/Prc, contains a PDZ domain n=1 Tax=Niabella drilacis (strain DSM 25811 / CCM 8410 / CCUG 62505 / LMG 26954 / E90) TaxID=1285928 RepID=A0A1G6U2D8_NIADE|nr:S41 family peptidase [Niabella drilacis]SDD34715.1 C-terminal processing protease CtpA/Prc, contains a PDZ domain [Niabella drilacis]